MKWVLHVILLLCSCNTITGNKDLKQKTVIDFDKITVNKNALFSIDLPAAVGRGFSWQLNDSSFEQKLHYEGQSFTSGPKDKDGSDGIQHFSFRALEKGSATIRFLYVQPFIKPYPVNAKTKSYQITIR